LGKAEPQREPRPNRRHRSAARSHACAHSLSSPAACA
jgi:hypothetical protein